MATIFRHLIPKHKGNPMTIPLTAPKYPTQEETQLELEKIKAEQDYQLRVQAMMGGASSTSSYISGGAPLSGTSHYWGPSTTTAFNSFDPAPKTISEEEFKLLQTHVIELAELVGELQDEIRSLKARRA